jgi:malate synthase
MVDVLRADAVAFVRDLERRFRAERQEVLARRSQRASEIGAGGALSFLDETAGLRADPTWRVPPPPPDLVDRRIEITGPTDAKVVINALNSGASAFMADFEDAATPTWPNLVNGQRNLARAVRRQLRFDASDGRAYELGAELATLLVRPRGWHLDERHVLVDGAPMSASLFDFGLYLLHNHQELAERGSGPYYYLPKLQSHHEAGLWSSVFSHSEEVLGLARGTVRATVLIETITAAFEMEEILFALRDHALGLNAGRWDYLFSIIKTFRSRGPEFVLPDRNAITMTAPFMRAYTELLVATCHRRGAMAIGGMSAFVPNRRDPEITARALDAVRADKTREAGDGFDGTWVAHPDLVETARSAFDAVLDQRPNQLDRRRDDVLVTADDLLAVASTPGDVTFDGVRTNVAVAIDYLTAWLSGQGAVTIDNLMEDVATAEICRSQLWQWIRAGIRTADGRVVTAELVTDAADAHVAGVRAHGGDAAARVDTAAALFRRVVLDDDFVEFLTVPALDLLEVDTSRMTALEITMTTDAGIQRRLYERMALMKAADDRLGAGIRSGEIQCVYWPSRGQEAIAAAMGECLRIDDQLVTTYRGLHDLIGKGVPLTEIYGEMMGRVVGGARGKGGTMHIVRPESGVMLSTGIVGAGPPVAVGLAMAARRKGLDRVIVVSFGDGATNTGSFHEAANMAAVWDLPIVFLCQNNRYAEMTPTDHTMKIRQVADRAGGYGMPGVRVDGNDPVAVLDALSDAVDGARRGDGPTLVECLTFRFRGHYFGDPMKYIPAEQMEAAVAADPIPTFRTRLTDAGVCSEAELEEIDAVASAEVEHALTTVLAAPAAATDELERDVYADARSCPA